MTLFFTAQNLQQLERSTQHGPLEHHLWQLIARAKENNRSEAVLVRVAFNRELGGVEITCRRWSWRAWLAWVLAGRGLPIGID